MEILLSVLCTLDVNVKYHPTIHRSHLIIFTIHEASACRSMCCPAILCYDVIVQGMFCHSQNSENECTILAFCGVTLHSTGRSTHTHLWWQRQVLMLTVVDNKLWNPHCVQMAICLWWLPSCGWKGLV